MPDKCRFKMTSYFSSTSTVTTSIPGVHLYFRGCSPGSPQVAIVGGIGAPTINQPYNWDQMSTFYTNYFCYGSKLKIKAYGTNGYGGLANMYKFLTIPSQNTTDFTVAVGNWEKAVDNKYRSKIGRYSWNGYGADTRSRWLVNYMTARKLSGGSVPDINDNPTNFGSAMPFPYDFWWNVLVFPIDLATNLSSGLTIEGTITYYGVAYNRKIQDLS